MARQISLTWRQNGVEVQVVADATTDKEAESAVQIFNALREVFSGVPGYATAQPKSLKPCKS